MVLAVIFWILVILSALGPWTPERLRPYPSLLLVVLLGLRTFPLNLQ